MKIMKMNLIKKKNEGNQSEVLMVALINSLN